MASLGNILVVEDRSDWRNRLRVILEHEHYDVQTATGYGEALGKLRNEFFHLVVLDLGLNPADEKNRDGEVLLIDIYERRIPTIIVTGHDTTELVKKIYKEYDVFSVLGKGNFDATNFRELVQKAIVLKEKIQIKEELTSEQKNRFQESTRELIGQAIKERGQVAKRLIPYFTILSGITILGGLILALIGFYTSTKMELGSWTIETKSIGIAMTFLGVVLFVFPFRSLIRYLRSDK